ncbi:DUF2189 domain-containing protein [Sneathiella chungangensis]|uniref:DUF2189 domain-containing protein n=1 Tax=Sneathiella chungangensis TaxID=1418234 RepID=A0A845MIG7_9PROT|nr:DUF2189 domain-containing protein [Sneathiella chungangensis]MZR22784.1 DUF2189 domain-containing protein [Sneathiella chungangensis]
MTRIPKTVPPLPPEVSLDRHLSRMAAVGWLRAGWEDMMTNPLTSLAYGAAVFIASLLVVASLYTLSLDYILFPALAGFMVVGPALAIGLYEKSRRIAEGTNASLFSMILVRPKSGAQILFIGVMLCLLMLLWMRAAVLLYALFFGLLPFPGLDHILPILTTPEGILLLIVGSLVGGLFASFSFAISVFAVPMLLNEAMDALTAMGLSMAIVWNNLSVMLTWGVIVLASFVVCLLTGLLGLIVIFPVLGHATWHAYKALR